VWPSRSKCNSARKIVLPTLLLAGLAYPALALDIQGVLPGAADQPQTNAELIDSNSNVLSDQGVSAIQAFLDTGTSGVILSLETQQGLGANLDSYNGTPTTFQDIAVGGLIGFNVSTPYTIALAPFSINTDPSAGGNEPDPSAFVPVTGPVRMETNPTPAPDSDFSVGPIDIMGMSALQNKVAVFDIRPINAFVNGGDFGETATYVYSAGTPYKPATLDTDPGIAPMQYHIKVSYANFKPYTLINPSAAPGPAFNNNPIVGPNPLNPNGDTTPPISISYNGHASTGSFLFDTGAAASFISTAEAAKLGVVYGMDGGGNPVLINSTTHAQIPNQFSIPITGAGGATVDSLGFYLDSLTVPTVEGEPINFLQAPVLVQDITVSNATSTVTLDGDLGMNFFEPSVDPSTLNLAPSEFDWMTFDQANGLIGVNLANNSIVALGTPTSWASPTSGNWSLVSNWATPTVPGSSTAVTFSTGSTTPYAVNLTANAAASSLSVQGDKVTLQKAGFNLNVSGAVNITSAGGHNGLLKLTGGGVSTFGSLSITSGQLDITDNKVVINYGVGNPSPQAAIKNYIAGGYNGDAWNGVGIVSSKVASVNASHNNPHLYAVAYADAGDAAVKNDGFAPGTVVIEPAIVGDANLDGKVNFTDFQLFSASYNVTNTSWDQGNFVYGAKTNFTDFQLLSSNFNDSTSLDAADFNAMNQFALSQGYTLTANPDGDGFSVTQVPEPAALSILLGASLILAFRPGRMRRIAIPV